jgi:hypothetical protein
MASFTANTRSDLGVAVRFLNWASSRLAPDPNHSATCCRIHPRSPTGTLHVTQDFGFDVRQVVISNMKARSSCTHVSASQFTVVLAHPLAKRDAWTSGLSAYNFFVPSR